MVQHNDDDSKVELKDSSKPILIPKRCLVLPTHFNVFRHQRERDIITQAFNYLTNSGFYWGPLEVDEAHGQLAHLPIGMFLIRDSMQPNVFFTLSYRAPEGPTSIRVLLKDEGFSLAGSTHSFLCLFGLLEYYINSPKKSLRRPYRGDAPQTLQELARRSVMSSLGKNSVQHLPISQNLKEFLHLYPFGI